MFAGILAGERPFGAEMTILLRGLSWLLPFLLFLGLYGGTEALFSSIHRSTLRQEPQQNGLALEFVPARAMQFLVTFILVLLAVFTALITVSLVKEDGGLYAPLIPMSVFVLILLAKPVTVVVDQEGIRQGRWLRSDRRIAWHDIASVEIGPNTGTTYVRSKDGGPKIRFSAHLVGRARFLREVRAHARDADIYSEEEET
jgi:uncharacterized Tic20 family protein